MIQISQLAEHMNATLRKVADATGAGFELQGVAGAGLYVTINLPNVEFSGLIPDGGEDTKLTGLFVISESFDLRFSSQLERFCKIVSTSASTWHFDPPSNKLVLSCECTQNAGEPVGLFVERFCVGLINAVMQNIAGHRSVGNGGMDVAKAVALRSLFDHP